MLGITAAVLLASSSLAASEPPVARISASLGLPFRGKWLVFWGGDTIESNAHLNHPSQRRAADLVMVDGKGSTHRNDGRKNEDYFAYGQEVLAVADGRVVTVIDGVHDNVPGEMNPYMAPGNLVIVEHGPGAYSAYAHLAPRSTKVNVGDKVTKGQALGACGNSGNSSEPHLHFQIQDGPLFEKSWGVTAVFDDATVVRNGKRLSKGPYEFHKGDFVEPAIGR